MHQVQGTFKSNNSQHPPISTHFTMCQLGGNALSYAYAAVKSGAVT